MEWDLSSIPNAKQYDLSSIPDAKERPEVDLSLLPDQKKSEDALSMAATFDIQPSAAYRNYDSIKGDGRQGNESSQESLYVWNRETYATAGQTMKWLGAEDQADVYGDFGKRLQRAYSYPVNQEDISWKNLSDSNWWATNVTSSIPFTLSLIPAAVLAAYAGGATATAIGWGAFGKTVLGSFMAAGVSRPMESALEAGGVYEEEFKRSGNEEKANEAANTSFKMNMYLGGMDIAEFATAFTPLRVLGKSANKSLMRRILATGGKLAATGGMEAGEEAIQSGIEQYSLGDEIDFGKMKTPAFVGGLFGVGMGGTGSVYTALRDKVIDTMPPDMNSIVNDAIQEGLKSGLPQQQAELKALDEIADTPEGRAHIEQVMETLKDPTKEGEPIAKVEEAEKVAPETAGEVKEPWEMTREEFEEGFDVEHGTTSPEVADKIAKEGLKLMPPRDGILDIPDSSFFLPTSSGLAEAMYSNTVLGKINPNAKILKAGTKEFKNADKGNRSTRIQRDARGFT